MQRKLVQQGKQTLFVSLPTTWVKENFLVKGSEVVIEEVDGNIQISPLQKRTQELQVKSITIDSINEQYLKGVFDNYNRNGFDIWDVSCKTKEQKEKVKEIVQKYFIGIQVIDEKEFFIRLQNVVSNDAVMYENISNRMLYIIKQMLVDCKGKKETKNYTDELFALKSYIQRLLRNFSKQQSNQYSTYISRLYLIASSIKKIQYFSEKELQEKMDDIIALFEMLQKMHLKKTTKGYEELVSAYQKLFGLLDTLKEVKSYKEVWHFFTIVRNIYLANESLQSIITENE